MSVTEEQITAALHEHATPVGDRWSFSGPPQTEKAARQIVEACLLLGSKVTDLATAEMWLMMVRRVVALEEQAKPAEVSAALREHDRLHRIGGQGQYRA